MERRQGLGGGARLKQKLIDQARALRERIGQQLGRVKEWVREHFPDPIGRLKERSREVFETVVEKAREARRRLTQEPEQGPERSAAGGQKPGTFDGLRLGAERSQGAPSGRDPFASMQFSATPEASLGRVQTPAAQTLSQSLDRYAQALMDAWRMRERDLPVLEHQKTELKAAGEDLDQHRPGARQALNSALRHELPVRRAMMEMEGEQRTRSLLLGIEQEAQIQRGPNLRAERLVKEWNGLEAQCKELKGSLNESARKRVRGQMGELTLEFKREPEIELVLKSRSRELGIKRGSRLGQVLYERNLERALAITERERVRSLGLGR